MSEGVKEFKFENVEIRKKMIKDNINKDDIKEYSEIFDGKSEYLGEYWI